MARCRQNPGFFRRRGTFHMPMTRTPQNAHFAIFCRLPKIANGQHRELVNPTPSVRAILLQTATRISQGKPPMTYLSQGIYPGPLAAATLERSDPRAIMAMRLPRYLQPFLTWLTARPAPGEAAKARNAIAIVISAVAWTMAGVAASVLALEAPIPAAWLLLAIGLLITTSGLGLFQVVVFHHCSHGTVFRSRAGNRLAGRIISATLLFKHFDAYQREHMMHHSAKKLLTVDDEFADFIFAMCGLAPSLPKRELWRRVLVALVSIRFHCRFLFRRVRASLASPDRSHNAFGIAAWALVLGLATASHHLGLFAVVWVLPVTVLLQIATVMRILCEHRFPPPHLIAVRGKEFVCLSTAGVFAGSIPPSLPATSVRGLLHWFGWWADMLGVQLVVRLFVLVGDAPCHDFHHRRPATRKWTNYIHARQHDIDAGCPGFPLNYQETWGLFRAIDENLATLASTPRDALTMSFA
jgi:fatty acid desaturase